MRDVCKEIIELFSCFLKFLLLILGFLQYAGPFMHDGTGQMAYNRNHHDMQRRTRNEKGVKNLAR